MNATASSSRAALPGPSPTKRPRLAGPSNSFDASPTRPSSRPIPSSSKSTPIPRSGTSSASTPLCDDEYTTARRASAFRVLSVWNTLEQRYSKPMDEDDILDLRTGRLVQDRGVLKGRDRPWTIGRLLGEAEKENDAVETNASSDAGEEEDEEEEDDGNASEKDDLLLESEAGDEPEETPVENEDEERDSDDELGEWDTVPAPPTPGESEPQTAYATPEPEPRPKAATATPAPDALSFLYSNVRPRLERLAREREQSPLPSEDLEAFMAAESNLRTNEGYVEPDGDDGDDVVFLGYGQRGTTSEEEEEEEQGSEVDDEDGRGELRTDDVDDNWDSDDELNDWPTVPAPNSDTEFDAQGDGFESNIGLEPEDPSDSEVEIVQRLPAPVDLPASRPASPVRPQISKPDSSGTAPSRAQLLTPPYSSRSDSHSGANSSPLRVPKERPALPAATTEKERLKRLESELWSDEPPPAESSKSKSIAPPKFQATPSKTAKPRAVTTAASTTTLTPTFNRLLRDSPTKSSTRRTPSRMLIPEVVIPLRSLSLSPRKPKPSEAVSPQRKIPSVPASKSMPSHRPIASSSTSKRTDPPAAPPKSSSSSSGNKRKRAEKDDWMELEAPRDDGGWGQQADVPVDRPPSVAPTEDGEQQQDHDAFSPQRDHSPPARSGFSSHANRRYDMDHVQDEVYSDLGPDGQGGYNGPDESDDAEGEERGPIASSSTMDPRSPRRPQRQYGTLYHRQETRRIPSPSYAQPHYVPAPLPTNAPPPTTPFTYQPSPSMPMPGMLPQAPLFAPGVGQEALLAQVLYSLNYLAYQNAVNSAANNLASVSAAAIPPPAPLFQAPAPGMFAGTPTLLPASPQVGYRMQSTPVAPVPQRQTVYHSSSSGMEAESMGPPSPRSILRNGSGTRAVAGTTTPRTYVSSSRSYVESDVHPSGADYKGKGRARAYGQRGWGLSEDGSDRDLDRDSRQDWRRGQSVSFSTSSSAVGEMSRRGGGNVSESPGPGPSSLLQRQRSVPGPLRSAEDGDDVFAVPLSPSSSGRPHNNSDDRRYPRTSDDTARTTTSSRGPHPLRDSFRPGNPSLSPSSSSSRRDSSPPRKLATQRSLPNIAGGERSRTVSDSSTAFGSGSTAVLANARAALSNSAARTSTLGISRTRSAKEF